MKISYADREIEDFEDDLQESFSLFIVSIQQRFDKITVNRDSVFNHILKRNSIFRTEEMMIFHERFEANKCTK